MLDTRAEYEDQRAVHDLMMKEGGVEGFRNNPIPVRTRPKVAAIWIHPHEMASRDYFWGGWMSCVIEEDRWILTKPGEMPNAPGVVDLSAQKKRGKHAKPKPAQKSAATPPIEMPRNP